MKIFLDRFKISDKQDSKGELSTIGNFYIQDGHGKEIFRCYSVENNAPSSDESGRDHRIMPRVYSLQWNFTKTSVAKEGFRNVDFESVKALVKESYHNRYHEFHSKHLGIQLITDEVKGFNERWIFIHIANSGKDIDGCIGLGYSLTDTGVAQSTQATQDFYNLVHKSNISDFSLEIKDF